MAGDPPAPPVQESTAKTLAAYNQYLPQLLTTTAAGIQPYEQARMDANKVISPQQAALQEELYRKFGPLLSQTSSQIDRQRAEDQAKTDLGVVTGTGRELVKEAINTSKLADPEYYATREKVGGRLGDLLGSIDLSGGLSAGEREEASRGLAQQNQQRGIATNPSQTAALEGAMTFGSLSKNRQDVAKNQLSNALSVANQSLPAMRSGMDSFQVATGRASAPNAGDNKFLGVDQNIGTQSGAFSGQLLNTVGGLTSQANEINANRRDSLDRVNQTLGGVGSLI